MAVGIGIHTINNGLTNISPERMQRAVVNVSYFRRTYNIRYLRYYMMKLCNYFVIPSCVFPEWMSLNWSDNGCDLNLLNPPCVVTLVTYCWGLQWYKMVGLHRGPGSFHLRPKPDVYRWCFRQVKYFLPLDSTGAPGDVSMWHHAVCIEPVVCDE